MAGDGLSSGSFGNVSAVDRDHNLLAITPSGVLYDTMQPEDICLLHLDGSAVDGVVNRYQAIVGAAYALCRLWLPVPIAMPLCIPMQPIVPPMLPAASSWGL